MKSGREGNMQERERYEELESENSNVPLQPNPNASSVIDPYE
jgi:hypothetical protein